MAAPSPSVPDAGYTAFVHLALLLSLVSGLTVQLGQADLSPTVPTALGGYTARNGKLCELPGEPLSARAAIFQSGRTRIALVSADLLTIPESLYEEVEKGLPEDLFLVLVATHTHCAPDSQALNRRMDFALPGIARFNADRLASTAHEIRSAVQKALTRPEIPLPKLAIRIGHRNLNRARREMAYPDTMAVRLLQRSGAPLLTHYAAHAVLYGPAHNRPDPDFPGRIRGREGLFLPGAIGDMSPASEGDSPAAQIAHFAQRFEEGSWSQSEWDSFPVRAVRVPISTGPVIPNPEFARLNRIPAAFSETIVKRFAPPDGFLTLFRIGKLAVVGVPGEPTAELGRKIRSIGLGLGFRAVLTVSHCNGWMGYILSPEDYDRGGYEASLAFHGREFGNRIVAKAKEGLAALMRP